MIPPEAEEYTEGEMTPAQTRLLGKGLCCVRFVKHESRHRPRLTLDGDDELGNDGQDLGASVLQHVVDSLAGKDLVRMNSLT